MKEIKRALSAVIAAGYMLFAAGCVKNSPESSTDTQSSNGQTVYDTEYVQSPDDESTSDITERYCSRRTICTAKPRNTAIYI